MAPSIRFFRQDGAIKYRQNGTVYTVQEGGEVSGTQIGQAVSEYLYHNPVTANWETLSGKPDVFPPDTHLHLENAPALHVHEGYANSTHVHVGYSNSTHTHSFAPVVHAHEQYANATHTHPSGGGNGYTLQVAAANQATTTDSQTVYWGGAHALAQQTSSGVHRLYIPKSGTIKACYIYVHAGTAGTGENWTMNIRLNNTSNTLVQTLGLASATRVWSNTNLNIAVVAGDFIEIQEVQPAWATNPANIRRNGVIYIE